MVRLGVLALRVFFFRVIIIFSQTHATQLVNEEQNWGLRLYKELL